MFLFPAPLVIPFACSFKRNSARNALPHGPGAKSRGLQRVQGGRNPCYAHGPGGIILRHVDFRAAMLDEHQEHLCPGRGAAAVKDACRAKNVVAGLDASPVALNLSRDDVEVFVTIGMTVRFIAPT